MLFCDAHIHLYDLIKATSDKDLFEVNDVDSYYVCCSVHTDVEYNLVKSFSHKGSVPSERLSTANEGSVPIKQIISFGILPQNPVTEQLVTLENLLKNNEINAVGECGFDFFTEEYKANKENQRKVFEKQAELAAEYGKPIIIHNRKALEMMFEYRSLLSQIPTVIFHSFAFGPNEAESIMKKGINAYFSFGKQLLNGNKKSIECVKNLPEEKLLFETDAPFQTLKNELYTKLSDIKSVYKEAAEIKNICMSDLCEKIKNNFIDAYCSE